MHAIAISPRVLEQVAKRGARDRILDSLEAARLAHIVVDMQHGFLAPGALVEVPMAREIVDNVNRISAAVRDVGGINVYLKMNLGTPATQRWRSFLDHLVDPLEREQMVAAFSDGSPDFALWDGLEVAPSDLVVEKVRYGAFVPGASRLHEELQERAIDTLAISGTLTNVCCESTARDAMQMDYRVIFVSDATATLSDEAHNSTLENMLTTFADVVSTDELVGTLENRIPARSTT